MKTTITLILFVIFSINYAQTIQAQTLPFDFESAVTTANFVDFDGGTATVLSNPQSGGINTSAMVAQIVREGGEPWSGSKILLDANLDFTTMNTISMKVFTTAPVGTTVKFKLEGGVGEPTTERDVQTTVSNEWEVLTWDFTGEPAIFNWVVFMFDFGNVGDGSINSTFLFDDVEQLFGGNQIDLPVDFEDSMVNYSMTDFGGNESSLVVDPMNPDNMVMQVIKLDTAQLWAGTTIGTSGGFVSNIPLTLDDSKMTVKVWSPEANIPIRLKVEDSNDDTHTCETETHTTVAGAWEYLQFDFTNQAEGTASLGDGLQMGWTYNMASIFFNFGTDGASSGETTYYFDDVNFGDVALSTPITEIVKLNVFPNPSPDAWSIVSDKNITLVEVFDLQGKLLFLLDPNDRIVNINALSLETGMYVSRISTDSEVSIVKLLKK